MDHTGGFSPSGDMHHVQSILLLPHPTEPAYTSSAVNVAPETVPGAVTQFRAARRQRHRRVMPSDGNGWKWMAVARGNL